MLTISIITSTIGVGATDESVIIQTDIGQQKLFLKAEKLLAVPNSREYKDTYNNLYYYPLQPYLDQRRLIDTMRLTSTGEIAKFLEKYEHTPLDWPLRKKWLTYLAKKKKESLFLSFYQQTSNVKLTCQNLTFSLNQGTEKEEVLPQVTSLWLTGKSLDKACDPIIAEWAESGYRTKEIVWQRLGLAADGGKHTLIPYLTSLLPKEEQYLGRLWHEVRRDPATIVRKNKFVNYSDKESEVYTYGVKRLIWRDPNTALKSYKKVEKKFKFSVTQQKEITEAFSIALASKNHVKAKEWLEKLDPISVDSNIIQWQLATVLKEQDWLSVLTELDSMPDNYKAKLQWQYWQARALIATNELERGQEVMAQLSSKRHYYGFLAASYLDTAVSLQDNPLNITKAEKNAVLLYPSSKRAFEFYHLGRFIEARREWRYWLSQLDDRQKLTAAKIANENGWYDRSIFTLSKVGYLNDVSLRFPKAFDEKINEHAKDHSINPAWAFAIARRESSFMTDANSPVGAKGLMQLMPGTAKQLKRGRVSTKYLYTPDNNIQLGTKYLRKLLDKNNGNQILATASYNAGPYRVKRWIKNSDVMPADIWIETIPYKETRNYVKSVLAYQEIYQHKPGETSELFDTVINMKIGG